jgi:hypothetical protein
MARYFFLDTSHIRYSWIFFYPDTSEIPYGWIFVYSHTSYTSYMPYVWIFALPGHQLYSRTDICLPRHQWNNVRLDICLLGRQWDSVRLDICLLGLQFLQLYTIRLNICLPGVQRYGYQMPGYFPRRPVIRITKYPENLISRIPILRIQGARIF